MSTLLDFAVPTPAWLAVLLGLTIKATLLLAAAGILAFVLRRASAAARHLVWSLALGGLLALPVLSVVLPDWRIPVLAAGAAVDRAPDPAFDASIAAAQPPATEVPVGSRSVRPGEESIPRTEPPAEVVAGPESMRTAARSALPWTVWVLAAAVSGALLVLVWLLAGQWGVQRLARRAVPVEDPGWNGLLRDLTWMIDLDRPVRLLRSDRASMPLTWGIIRPALLLPSEADWWSEERRRVVLLHELAHVKRFDCLTQTVAQFACAFFWFHPLVWYAAHRMRVERERACDDLVLGAGTPPSNYAGHLLEVARSFRSAGFVAPATVSMARPSQLEGRLLAVLDPARSRRGPTRRAGTLAALAALGLVLPLAAMQPGTRTADGSGKIPTLPSARASAARPSSTAPDFRWRGRIAPGRAIEIRGVIGDIRAVATSGDAVEVTATKRGEDSDPETVDIRVVEHGGGVTICAVYPPPPRDDRPNTCRPGEDGQLVDVNDNYVEVDFTVQVPAGVRFVGRTVLGDVQAQSLRSEVDATTVRGDVRVSTTESAEAQTVSGSIRAALGSAPGTEPLGFGTVSGDIVVTLPAGANAEVRGKTTSGDISTEFPLRIREGGFIGESLSGTIGRGGRPIVLQTVSGNIRLLRAGGERSLDARSAETRILGRTRPAARAADIGHTRVQVDSLNASLEGLGERIDRMVEAEMARLEPLRDRLAEEEAARIEPLIEAEMEKIEPLIEAEMVRVERELAELEPLIEREIARALAEAMAEVDVAAQATAEATAEATAAADEASLARIRALRERNP